MDLNSLRRSKYAAYLILLKFDQSVEGTKEQANLNMHQINTFMNNCNWWFVKVLCRILVRCGMNY